MYCIGSVKNYQPYTSWGENLKQWIVGEGSQQQSQQQSQQNRISVPAPTRAKPIIEGNSNINLSSIPLPQPSPASPVKEEVKEQENAKEDQCPSIFGGLSQYCPDIKGISDNICQTVDMVKEGASLVYKVYNLPDTINKNPIKADHIDISENDKNKKQNRDDEPLNLEDDEDDKYVEEPLNLEDDEDDEVIKIEVKDNILDQRQSNIHISHILIWKLWNYKIIFLSLKIQEISNVLFISIDFITCIFSKNNSLYFLF